MWITGRHSVSELLASARQKARKVLLSDEVPPAVREAIAGRAGEAGIPVLSCRKEEWRRRTGESEGAGIGAEIAEFRYDDLAEWLRVLPEKAAAFLLDGITDPQNLGAIVRTARGLGLAGVVVPKDRSCPVTGAVFRASAGAAAHLPVVQVTNLARAVDDLKESGFWVFAAERRGDTPLSRLDPPARAAFVLGSEEGGIRRLVREKCDGSVAIPLEPGVESLNVSVAAGIIAFRLREARGGG